MHPSTLYLYSYKTPDIMEDPEMEDIELNDDPGDGLPPRPPPQYEPSWRRRGREFIDRNLPRLVIPVSLLVGGGITGTATWAVARHVIYLLKHAKVSSDPTVWIEKARKDYDRCYFGCLNCNDLSYAAKACRLTALIKPNDTSINCDGAKMWNWADRYPDVCLAVRGEQHRAEALAHLKQSYLDRCALVILTMLAGMLGFVLVYLVLSRLTGGHRERAAAANITWPGERRRKARPERRSLSKKMIIGFLPFLGKASAYACTGYGSADRYFASSDRMISVHVHGYFSDCVDTQLCTTSCINTTCYPSCYTSTSVDSTPMDVIGNIAPRIVSCGFIPVVPGPEFKHAGQRLAHPGIEESWWVTVKVSGLNVTNANGTDASIWCLHDIGG
ncbi:hypothetical protein F5Y16DRAFT_381708 [Xylariaceae sp. FL0255]|nr:hypothetical protein F5Y16DRAFT_381708 [Xylariaceae sp. FL0255]